MGALEAGPHRIGGAAVDTVPFLRIKDRMVLAKAKAYHVLTTIHCSRYTCGLSDRTHVPQPNSNSFCRGRKKHKARLLLIAESSVFVFLMKRLQCISNCHKTKKKEDVLTGKGVFVIKFWTTHHNICKEHNRTVQPDHPCPPSAPAAPERV